MTKRKEAALVALMSSTTLAMAAEKAGVSPKTLYNYLHHDNEFMERYAEEKRKLLTEATEAIQKSMLPAVTALHGMVSGEKEAYPPEIQACRAVLDYALKLTETNDILQRLQALEAASDGRN